MFRVYSSWVAENSNPGQFVILKTDEKGERIPLTIADYDRENGLVTVVIQAIGMPAVTMLEKSSMIL